MFPESPSFLHEAARRPPARHRFDPGSLLAAALFAGLATVGLMGERVSLGHQLRWIWPLVFLGTGVALLISAASRAREPARPDSWDKGPPIGRPMSQKPRRWGRTGSDLVSRRAGHERRDRCRTR